MIDCFLEPLRHREIYPRAGAVWTPKTRAAGEQILRPLNRAGHGDQGPRIGPNGCGSIFLY